MPWHGFGDAALPFKEEWYGAAKTDEEPYPANLLIAADPAGTGKRPNGTPPYLSRTNICVFPRGASLRGPRGVAQLGNPIRAGYDQPPTPARSALVHQTEVSRWTTRSHQVPDEATYGRRRDDTQARRQSMMLCQRFERRMRQCGAFELRISTRVARTNRSS